MNQTTHNPVPAADLARFIAEKTSHNLFLTGKAGTGKTVFLRDFVAHTKKKVVVLAPTGIAAINANAMTIHSFCRFGSEPCPRGRFSPGNDFVLEDKEEELVRNMDLVIIDEVSMVRADVMDHISEKFRLIRNSEEPFGGVQLLLIGDLFQLPPVVTKKDEKILKDCYEGNYFFFNSRALKKVGFETVCLDKVYRQNNPEFVGILNRARVGKVSMEDCNKLNTRYVPDFEAPDGTEYINLVAQRKQADSINDERLGEASGETWESEAEITGDFPDEMYPTNSKLVLKQGAQVMFVKNDKENRFCNGTIGEVVEAGKEKVSIKVAGETIAVEPNIWENIRYESEGNKVGKKVVGTFKQFPIRPAWAITIHKSQGLSFDNAVIDIPRAFAAGQAYVALSRCRSLEGLVLRKKLSPDSFFTDPLVSAFYDGVDNAAHIEELAKAVGYAPFEWDDEVVFDGGEEKATPDSSPLDVDYVSALVEEIIQEIDYPIYHLNLEFGSELYDIQVEVRKYVRYHMYYHLKNPYYGMKMYPTVSKEISRIVREKYHSESWTLLDI